MAPSVTPSTHAAASGLAPSPHPRGGRLIGIAQGLRLLVRLGSAAVLARLLSPTDYGLQGMAAAMFGLLSMAKDAGVVTALQQTDLTPQKFNALCRLGIGGGFALAALGVAVAWPTGWFFGETAVVPWVLAAMSGAFVFTGAGAPAVGLLYREQRGGLVALLEAVAMAIGAIVAIMAARAGAGVWALVLLTVIQEGAFCVLAWSACSTRPKGDVTNVDWRRIAAFGGHLTGYNVAAYGMRTLDQVTLGWASGAAALGLYARGAQIAALPVQFAIGPFNPWIVATLAGRRDTPEGFAAFVRLALNSLLHVSLAGAALCLAVPDRMLWILFGEAWLPATPVVRWLGVALAVQPWLAAPAWLLSAPGTVRRLLAWSLAGAGLMLAGCALVYPHGGDAIAGAAGLAALLHAAIAPAFCAGRSPARLRDWLAPSQLPLAVHGGAAAVLLFAAHQAGAAPGSLPYFAVPAGIVAGYYGLMALLYPPFRRELRGLLFWPR